MSPLPPRRARTCRAAMVLVSVLLLVLLTVPVRDLGAGPDEPPVLVGFYETWLLSVDHLLTDAERRAFERLTTDVERELFIRRFWEARRGPDGELAAAAQWQRRFAEARRRFRDVASDRSRALLLAGSPAQILGFGGCGGPLRRLEIWSYDRWQLAGLLELGTETLHLVFYEPTHRPPGTFELWAPASGPALLMTQAEGLEPRVDDLLSAAIIHPCATSTMAEMRRVREALETAWDLGELRRRLAPATADPVWLERFAAELAAGRARLPAAPAELTPIGHLSHYVVVRARLRVPLGEIARNADGRLFDRVAISGDIWQNGRFVAPFQVVHHIAGTAPDGEAVALDVYRRLRPGTYELDLRMEDAHGLALARETRRLELTWHDRPATPPAGYRRGFAGLLRGEVGMLTTFASVRLLASSDALMAGAVEIAAVTTGGPIGRVDFLLDGELAARDFTAPWVAELELGPSPEPRRLTAVAYDPSGREIDRDETELNVGAPRFLVRLASPRRGASPVPGRPLEVRAEVEVPRADTLDRVELYLDEERFATLREPPFVHPLPPPPGRDSYLRAVAILTSGEETEDIVMLGPRPSARVDVDLVELFTSVVDGTGRPVLGLTASDFTVRENGVEQSLTRFDTVQDLPIHVLLMMDISQSMRERMAIASGSAQQFFEEVLTPRDRAALLSFNHDIDLLVPFTHEVDRLRAGASGLRAWGSTRLWDSVVYAGHAFSDRQGKKALVILSDGADVDSDFPFRQVREHTLRAGVAAYPIGLSLDHPETEAHLGRLAAATGGRFFPIRAAAQLSGVYRQIEQDLRSQYLLVYRPPAGAPRSEFRKVEVAVAGEGLTARTIHGYYP